MNNILLSITSFFLGIILLRKMYIWEQTAGASIARFASIYFMVQHFSFGLGGLLVALFDQGYYYVNMDGVFPYSDSLVKLELINLVSLFAALLGVRTAIVCWRMINTRRVHGLISQNIYSSDKMMINNTRQFQKMCYVSLAFHTLITGLQWYHTYTDIPDLPRYMIQIGAQVVPATFFFWGIWWQHGGRERIIFVSYMTIYGLIQLASGGRGPFLYAVFIFYAGIIATSKRWILRPRRIAIVSIIIIILPLLVVISEDIRLLYSSRRPENINEWTQRVSFLVGKNEFIEKESILSDTELMSSAMFRFSTRILEPTALDMVARTPKELPFWGWSYDDWLILWTGWLPTFIFPDLPAANYPGILFLREYGWEVDPAEGNSMPPTVLADSWRRFGWLGIVIIHFFWAMFLSTISIYMGRQYFRIRALLFSSALIYVLTFSYTNDVLTLFTSLPRRFITVLIYTAIISIMCSLNINSTQYRKQPTF